MIERIAITSREQWLACRQKDVTASVAGALLGVHPYATAYGLHLLKAGKISDDVEETPPMRRGRLLEPVAVQLLAEERPDWKIEEFPVGHYYRDPEARIGATPDVFAVDENGRPGIVQVKTVEPSIFRREWRDEDGTVTPPVWIVVQAIIEAHLTGREWAAVAPMIVGFGLELPVVPVPLHAGIVERIKAEVRAFWDRIKAGTAPDPDYGRDGAFIAKVFGRDNGAEVNLGQDNRAPILVDELAAVKAEIKSAETRKEAISNEIKAKLGEHSFGRLGDGRLISWKLQQRKAFSVEATEFRVLRVGKG